MIHKSEFEQTHPQLHEGMIAYTRDGQELGRVAELGDDSLTLEGGAYFPRDFTIRYDDIAETRPDSIVIAREEPELHEWREAGYAGWQEYEKRNVAGFAVEGVEVRGVETAAETETEPETEIEPETEMEARPETEESARIPLHEEELEVKKVARQKGEVRVRKVVHTEIRDIEVPVTREEIVVERRPAEGGVEGGEEAFQTEETRIPIMEEDVEVHKRQVKKGDVHIRKEKRVERKKISEEVRSEDVEVEHPEKKDPEQEA